MWRPCEPDSQIEIWFRKAPASFSELVARPDPAHYRIINMGYPCHEFGNTLAHVFINAFWALRENLWVHDGVKLRLGHSDLLVAQGKSSMGAVLINKETTPVPYGWYPNLSVLGQRLTMIHLGRIQ